MAYPEHIIDAAERYRRLADRYEKIVEHGAVPRVMKACFATKANSCRVIVRTAAADER
jgi:hypothetical protein